MKRRLITSTGPTITLPQIPERLDGIVREPKHKLTRENQIAVGIYEAVLKYQLFSDRPWTWKDASARPESRCRRWDRCPTCERVLIEISSGIVGPCSLCRKDELSLFMWGD